MQYSSVLYISVVYALPSDTVNEEDLKQKIAGEMVLSANFGATLRKWRTKFNVSQKELADFLGISPSVISDYEANRRRSPGVLVVKRLVEALLAIDRRRGRPVMKEYMLGEHGDIILDMTEFPFQIPGEVFLETIEGEVVNNPSTLRPILGYTVIDSLQAIVRLSSYDYLRVYGWSTERALLFTGVRYGRSPMVAIRAHPLSPAMVVYISPENVDPLAVKIADLENVCLVKTPLPVQNVLEALSSLKEKVQRGMVGERVDVERGDIVGERKQSMEKDEKQKLEQEEIR